MKSFKFKNGVDVPALGFGTWKLEGQGAVDSVLEALNLGYRHIDTADKYGNHREVGEAMAKSGINRSEIFLTTKVWHSELAPDALNSSVDRFFDELSTDYIDLLLIHWPNRNVPLEETLEAMNKLKEKGAIKNIGVSNFTINHLKKCLETEVEVVNNQVEIHPTFAQFELQEFAKEQGIILTAYSPLGRGADLEIGILSDIAKKHGKTVPQVILNWLVARGIIVIPKASSKEHIEENYRSLDFELSGEEVELINGVDKGERLIAPEWNEFGF
jgi:2,5-diketo-D-gluconate reductase B